MALGVEIVEMGWDLSLPAQSRRALTMNNVWLREEGEGKMNGNREDSYMTRNPLFTVGNTKPRYGQSFDSILGINLKGKSVFLNQSRKNLITDQAFTDMEHDLEDGVLIAEEGKKRDRWEMDVPAEIGEITLVARNRRLLEINHLSSATAKRQADRAQ